MSGLSLGCRKSRAKMSLLQRFEHLAPLRGGVFHTGRPWADQDMLENM